GRVAGAHRAVRIHLRRRARDGHFVPAGVVADRDIERRLRTAAHRHGSGGTIRRRRALDHPRQAHPDHLPNTAGESRKAHAARFGSARETDGAGQQASSKTSPSSVGSSDLAGRRDGAMRRAGLCALLGALALSASAVAAVDALAIAELADGNGIHLEAVEQLGARQLHVPVSPAALPPPVDVRILLPTDYATATDSAYPVLYLFHGTSGRASDWVNFGDAERTTAGLPLIVVMPDAGFNGDGGGWFTNWFNGG